MKHAKIIPSKLAHSQQSNSFRTSATLILTTLMLLIAASTTAATAQTYTDLFNFNGTDGANPEHPALLAQGRDGNLYGTTCRGGTGGAGVVFKITSSGDQTVLYNFDGGTDGACPEGGLTLGTDGNFYGTTYQGGANLNSGTIFKITPAGNLTTLYSFCSQSNCTDGSLPYAPPIQGTDGNFYGTTAGRGEAPPTAYKITSSGTFTLLATLPHRAPACDFYNCGSKAPLLQGTDGNFYGTTETGGAISSRGTAFKITPQGILTIICSFGGARGYFPSASLIQGSDGNFYGTAKKGTAHHTGDVFKLTPQGAFTVLHRFSDAPDPKDGAYPVAGLVQATDGNFYGATHFGGNVNCRVTYNRGCGVIFQITPAGAYSILYRFDDTHGASPMSTPVQHTNGKIYGLATNGGASNDGVVYSLDMGLAPFVSLVSTSGKVGQTVEILGQGFTGTTAVAFNGTAATFTVVSDTYLTATVPTGATTGFVTVTTPSGTLTSNTQFRVKP